MIFNIFKVLSSPITIKNSIRLCITYGSSLGTGNVLDLYDGQFTERGLYEVIKNNAENMKTNAWISKLEEKLSSDISGIQMAGHAKELHYGQTDKDIASRIEKEGKANISSFYEEADMDKYVAETMLSFKEQIASWMQDGRNLEDLVLRLPNAAEVPIGFGFNSDYEEIVTKDVKVVLSKHEPEQDSEFGFFVKTAYADIESKDALKSGRAWKTGYQYHAESEQEKDTGRESESPKEAAEKERQDDLKPGGAVGILYKLSAVLSSIPKFFNDVIHAFADGLRYVFPNFKGFEHTLESYGVDISVQESHTDADFDDSWLKKENQDSLKEKDYVWKEFENEPAVSESDIKDMLDGFSKEENLQEHSLIQKIENFVSKSDAAGFFSSSASKSLEYGIHDIISYAVQKYGEFCTEEFSDDGILKTDADIEFLDSKAVIHLQFHSDNMDEPACIDKEMDTKETELFLGTVYEMHYILYSEKIMQFSHDTSLFIDNVLPENTSDFHAFSSYVQNCMKMAVGQEYGERISLFLDKDGCVSVNIHSDMDGCSFNMHLTSDTAQWVMDNYYDELIQNTEDIKESADSAIWLPNTEECIMEPGMPEASMQDEQEEELT